MSRATKQAHICADAMDAAGFSPATIISVGVGSSPEHTTWVKRFPNAKRIGIDPRGRHRWGNDLFINAAIMDFAHPGVVWCGCCRSVLCPDPYGHINPEGHKKIRRHVVPAVTLDDVARKHGLAPFFLWMDCEGSECAALRGGSIMLRQTPFISTEVLHCGAELDPLLKSLGYSVLRDESKHTLDRLYHDPTKLVAP